ncbi:unnamed protein product [Vicia faba]|uniref:Uncharacterized protein n=1 Tax=Vicia faba TaxID=3906 RepID=A0AAV0ZSA6_VICFA|nr:unnamed protein product [Vicia faba]
MRAYRSGSVRYGLDDNEERNIRLKRERLENFLVFGDSSEEDEESLDTRAMHGFMLVVKVVKWGYAAEMTILFHQLNPCCHKHYDHTRFWLWEENLWQAIDMA